MSLLHIARAIGAAIPFRVLRLQAAGLCALLALGACASVAPPPNKSKFVPPTVVSKAVTFAPAAMAPDAEIEQLSRFKTAPAQLRVAWLHLQQKRVQNCLDATAEVLYATKKPSAHEESFARYLRAEAFELSGQGDRGAYDRGIANQLAIDAELRKLLAAKTRKAAPVEASSPATFDLAVQPRSAWGASTPDRGNVEPMQPIDRVTIHHSAIYFRDTRPGTCGSQIAGIQRQHMQKNGWGDIGYHFLIDPSGRIWQGRELRFQGAHAGGDSNISNVGICLLGNFMRSRKGQEPTRAQVQSMRQLVAELMRVYRFGPDAIHCHHDFKETECPGELMTPIVSQMARDFRRTGAGRGGAAAEQ